MKPRPAPPFPLPYAARFSPASSCRSASPDPSSPSCYGDDNIRLAPPSPITKGTTNFKRDCSTRLGYGFGRRRVVGKQVLFHYLF